VTKRILKEPKIVLIDKIYYLDHSTDKQMQLISILLTATLARFFSFQATRPERKENTVDIMSVHCSFARHRSHVPSRERDAPRLISIRNNQEYLFHAQRSAIFNWPRS